MFQKLLTLVFLASAPFVGGQALADLPVVLIEETRLPYDLSSANYDNSSANYDNSISNYDNSPSNYDNAESNYNNSPSNYDNGRNGKRRLVYQDGATFKFAGYYVVAQNGVTNFFAASGTRLFYNPKKSRGVYGGKDGNFCGVLGRVDGKFSVALTDRGLRQLLLSQ